MQRQSPVPPHLRLRSVLVVLLLSGMGACADDDGATGAGLPDLDAVPALEYEETTRIGSTDDPDYGFSRIGLVSADDDGNVYVVERQDVEIRVYSPAGELLRRIGGRGDGPGEFSFMIDRLGISGDTVWTFEGARSRLTYFTRAGELLGTAPVESLEAPLFLPGESTWLWPTFMTDSAFLVSDGGMVRTGFGEPERDSVDVPVVRFTTDGRLADTIGAYPRVRRSDEVEHITVGRSRYTVPRPPDTQRRVVRTSDGLVFIDLEGVDAAARVRVTRLTYAGDTVRTSDFAYRPTPFPDAVLDSLARQQARSVGPMITVTSEGIEQVQRHAEDSAAARAEIRRRMAFPAAQPPVQGHILTDDGSLWLRREDAGDERRYTVLDARDIPVGEVTVPRTLRIAWAGRDSFWAVEQDELDVPWLVRYELQR